MPFRSYQSYEFSESGIATYAPFAPGIYGIHNGRRLWIYIEQAENIRIELSAHLRDESVCRARILQNRPAYFTFEKNLNRLVLPIRKEELIREYRPCLQSHSIALSHALAAMNPAETATQASVPEFEARS
jgi:hypothetical protein